MDRLQATVISLLLSLISAHSVVEYQQQREQLSHPKFCNNLDCPDYVDVKNYSGFQERRYKASTWVTTAETGVDFEKAQSDMFMKLFEYIQGNNVKGEKIAMTAPVKTRILPGQGPACVSNFTMSFFVAAGQKPPQPKDKSLYIENVAAQTFYVREFGGFARKFSTWEEQAEDCEKAFDKAGVKDDIVPDHYYVCGYDSPFRLFNRHNEIWFLKK